MKKLKALILILAVFSTALINQGGTFAATTTEVPFDLTPLPINTDLRPSQYAGRITIDPPAGDYTSNLTYSSSTNLDDRYVGFGYRLKIPSSTSQCDGGAKPYLVGFKTVLETKAANPNNLESGNTMVQVVILPSNLNLFENGSTYDYSSTAPEGSLIGTLSYSSFLKTPMPMDTFNSEDNLFVGYVNHYINPTAQTFTATTAPPTFSALLNCSNVPVTGSQTGGTGGGGGTTDIDDAKEKANTPATGAVEVIAFVTGAALVFVLYEATRMYKKKSASRASVK